MQKRSQKTIVFEVQCEHNKCCVSLVAISTEDVSRERLFGKKNTLVEPSDA